MKVDISSFTLRQQMLALIWLADNFPDAWEYIVDDRAYTHAEIDTAVRRYVTHSSDILWGDHSIERRVILFNNDSDAEQFVERWL